MTNARKRGRPGVDWGLLYVDWINSGMTKNAFLRSRGYNYKGGAVSRNTRRWLQELCKLSLRLHAQYIRSATQGHRHIQGVTLF